MRQQYEPAPGEHIRETAKNMIALVVRTGRTVEATFNDLPLTARFGDNADLIVSTYHAEIERRGAEYRASPEYAQRQAEARAAQEAADTRLAALLATSPPEMSLADPEGWAKAVEANQDPYGSGVIRFAETWARLMEGRMTEGQTLEACADEMSHVADNHGITGFMYGCAVSILAAVWARGDALRRWHNLKTQIRDEGERANESGGVLNPAVLVLGSQS